MREKCPRCGTDCEPGKVCVCGFDAASVSIQPGPPPHRPDETAIHAGPPRLPAPRLIPDPHKPDVESSGGGVFLWIALAVGIGAALLGLPKRSFFTVALLLGGPFCLLAAIFDWDWFFNNRRARAFVEWFGRGGARVFYAILGAVITSIGVWSIVTKDYLIR